MSCISPVSIRNPKYDPCKPVSADNLARVIVPCGHCYCCRKANADSIALRIKHERLSRDYKSCFVTFTFNDVALPPIRTFSILVPNGSHSSVLRQVSTFDFYKRPLQLFFKRLRRYIAYHKLPYRFKMFSCGEFGHKFGRPHFHSILIGVSKFEIEPLIQKFWDNFKKCPMGFSKVKDCDANASYYCTKYMKKSNNSAWWSEYSPKYLFDSVLRRMKSIYLNGVSADDGYHVKRSGKYEVLYKDCKHCPFYDYAKRIVLNCRSQVKKYFNNAHKSSFSWSSLGIGKDFALDHMEEFLRKGFVPNGFSKSGEPIVQPIPRNYKNYYLKRSQVFVHPSYRFTYSDLFPARSNWQQSFAKMKDDVAFPRFLKVFDLDLNDFKSPTDSYQILHFFNRWLSSEALPKEFAKQEFYETFFRGKSWIGTYNL